MGVMWVFFVAMPASAVPEPDRRSVQETLGIPMPTAFVRDYRWRPRHKLPDVILIEDIHCHPEAQGKIASMLLYAHHRWNCKTAYVEGAFGDVGPPPYPIFTAQRGDLSANQLLLMGRLSAGELAAALVTAGAQRRPSAFRVIGMEDYSLYRQQLETFQALLQVQRPAIRRLRPISKSWRHDRIAKTVRLFTLRLRPQEYQAYTPETFSDPVLENAQKLAERYYELAEKRSHRFIQRTGLYRDKAPCLIVTGGFHIPTLTQSLRRQGKSYVVLSPKISQPMDRGIYRKSLTESLDVLKRSTVPQPWAPNVRSLQLSLAHRND